MSNKKNKIINDPLQTTLEPSQFDRIGLDDVFSQIHPIKKCTPLMINNESVHETRKHKREASFMFISYWKPSKMHIRLETIWNT